MSKLFAIGDLHLSFSSEKPMGVFGVHWDDHHLKVEENWRSVVADCDTVIVAGDISWALKFPDAVSDLEWIHGLPGRKIILKGNHDLWWQSVTRLRELYEDMFFLQNDSMEICGLPGIFVCGSRGWLTPQEPAYCATDDEKIYARELIRLRLSLEDAKKKGAERIIVSLHFAPSARPDLGSGFTELIDEYGVSDVVYGHLHGREAYKKGIKGRRGDAEYALVSCDFVDFSPHRIL